MGWRSTGDDRAVFGVVRGDDEERVVLKAFGELDVAGRPSLDFAIDHLVAHEPARDLLLDLTGLLFLDSSGVHGLIRASRRLVGSGGRLRLRVAADSAVSLTLQTVAAPELDVDLVASSRRR